MREPGCAQELSAASLPCPGAQESCPSWLQLSHPETSVPCHCWPCHCHPVPGAAPVPAWRTGVPGEASGAQLCLSLARITVTSWGLSVAHTCYL